MTATVTVPRARADPAGPVPARLRSGRRAPGVVLGARQRAAGARPGRRAPRGRAARRATARRRGDRARWHEHVRAAHADGYAVVAGSIDWRGGLLHPRPKALEPYAPGVGRVPGFGGAAPLPVGAAGRRADAARGRRRSPRVRRAAGRAVDLRRAGGAHSSTAIRSSTDLKTSAPTTSATIAATTRVDHVARVRCVPRPDRVADGKDRRRDRVDPVQDARRAAGAPGPAWSSSSRGSAWRRTTGAARRPARARRRGRGR